MRAKKGIVTNISKDKTVTVIVHRYINHSKYKKRFRVSKKFHVHNPDNKKFEIGEIIPFYECRPISKMKKWTIIAPVIASESK